jgi:tetratricopeptide (TPR) repeat protein
MKDGDGELAGKNFRRAIAEFARAIELDPQHALAHYKLAQALEGSGDANAALASYYRYLQVAPGGQYSVDAAASVDRLKKQGATISQSVQTRP